MNKFITFGAPDIQKPEIDEIVDSLNHAWLGTGPKVIEFERNFSLFKGVDSSCVVAVNSCTAALHLSLIASGVGPGDEVITTPMTFCATVNSIIHTGATPVLADVDPETFNINPQEIARKLSPRTRALIVVHFAGYPCNMAPILELCAENKLTLIEDCAHAVEASTPLGPCGTIGDFGCFSFYATKNITCGEGGMVVCKSPEIARRIRRLSQHGLSDAAWERYGNKGFKNYQVEECGYKYNMMDLQAAIGLHQLSRVWPNLKKRREVWRRYDEALLGLPVRRPKHEPKDGVHGLHLYAILVGTCDKGGGTSRDAVLQAMTDSGVGVGVHYLSVAEHPYYRRRFGWSADQWPIAKHIGRSTLSLPLMPQLELESQRRVISVLEGALRRVGV